MRLRSTWTPALLMMLFGCSSGTIGSVYGGPTSGGNGGGSGVYLPPGYTITDGGVILDDAGHVVAPDALPPPPPSSGAGSGIGNGSGASSGTPAPSTTPPSGGAANVPLARLTAIEYANTVNDLLGIPPSAQTVPLNDGSSVGGFTLGGAATDGTAQAYRDSAVAIAGVATSAASLPGLLKAAACAPPAGNSGSAGAACAAAFINQFAPIAYRHGAVDPAAITGLNGVYMSVSGSQGFSGGIAAVLEEILQSPYFLYHLETEQQALGMYGTAIPVTGYSLANRLSYLLWASMPDSTLLAAAANNQLLTAAQVQTQATRMLQDSKAKVGLRNFYQQWLTEAAFPNSKLGNSTQVTAGGALSSTSLWNNGTPTGESYATVFSQAVQQAVVQSFNQQVEDALWAPSNVMKTLLTGDTVYANAATAPLFGVTGVTGNTLQKVQVDATKRIGILSHPLLMAAYATGATSHPIKRGRFVWDQIVCQPLPNPPASVPPFTAPQPGMSLRQDFETLTATGAFANEPTCTAIGATSLNGMPCTPLGTNGLPLACPSCHSRINPIGFLFEPFDTVGQYRTIDDYGQPVALTNITVVGAADPVINVPTSTSVQLANNLASSDLPSACLTANLYRFMIRRNDGAADIPIENWLDQTFGAAGQNLSPVLIGLTQTDAFLKRMNVQ